MIEKREGKAYVGRGRFLREELQEAMKKVDVDKTASEIYAEVFNGKPWTRWEELGDTSKTFYRKIARWHLRRMALERKTQTKGGD